MEVVKLKDKQEVFCQEYLIDLNATQAALRAGYSEKTARNIGCENLTKPNIQARIAELLKLRNEGVKISADYVLRRLIEIDNLDVVDIMLDDLSGFKPLSQWPKVWRTSLSGLDLQTITSKSDDDFESVVKKIKWPDKVKNLELIGKHVDVQAFLTKQETKHVLSDDFESLLDETINDEE